MKKRVAHWSRSLSSWPGSALYRPAVRNAARIARSTARAVSFFRAAVFADASAVRAFPASALACVKFVHARLSRSTASSNVAGSSSERGFPRPAKIGSARSFSASALKGLFWR